MRGNVLDLAVGVIIGAAFGKSSGIVGGRHPDAPIGRLVGRVDFSSLFVSLNGTHYDSLALAKAAGAPTVNYGLFLNTIINFLIVALAVFFAGAAGKPLDQETGSRLKRRRRKSARSAR